MNHHYFYLGQRDIQAVGTLNDFNRWSDQTDTAMNQLITNAGGNGKIGDREVYRVGSTVYEVVEAQVNRHHPMILAHGGFSLSIKPTILQNS